MLLDSLIDRCPIRLVTLYLVKCDDELTESSHRDVREALQRLREQHEAAALQSSSYHSPTIITLTLISHCGFARVD